MRIAQVIHGFPPENAAGSELYAYYLSKELARRHSVFVFYRIADRSLDEYAVVADTFDGLPVSKLNNTFKECDSFSKTYRNDIIDRRFGEFLDLIGPDVVHFHHVTCLSTNLVRVAKERGVPVIFTLHDFWLICQRGQLVKRDLSLCQGPKPHECARCLAHQLSIRGGHQRVAQLYRRTKTMLGKELSRLKAFAKRLYLLRAKLFFMSQRDAVNQIQERTRHIKEICGLVDLFISPSQFLRAKFVEYGAPPGKILVSKYGHQTSYFSNFTKRRSGKLRFGYIGTLIPSKGVHVLVEAFNGVQNADAELEIHGSFLPYEGFEDYPDLLPRLVRNERIRFLGGYQHTQISNILAGIDVLVVPSIWHENSPLTLHEAFLARTPVIASDLGGMAELIQDGVNGLLFKAEDAADLREKIEMVVRRPDLIAKLSANIGPVKTIEENAIEVEGIYRDFVTRSQRLSLAQTP